MVSAPYHTKRKSIPTIFGVSIIEELLGCRYRRIIFFGRAEQGMDAKATVGIVESLLALLHDPQAGEQRFPIRSRRSEHRLD